MVNNHKSIDIDAYLISLMMKHSCIWDKRDVFYKDYARKCEAWDAIAATLKLDADSVRRRWDNLRDRFVRVYREYTVLGNPKLATSKFKLFNDMLWLAPHIRRRRMTCASFAQKTKTAPQIVLSEDTENSESTENQDISIKIETQSNLSEKTNNESYSDEEEVNLAESVSEPVESNNETGINKSDHYFMMSIVHDCQGMPPRKKLKFKREVLGLLEKYLYSDDK